MSVIYQGQNIFGLTSRNKKIKIGEFITPGDTHFYVGGKIFHIVDGDNGATYHFYDQYGDEITDVQVGDTPFAYSVEGTPTFDKYYIFRTSAYTSKTWTYQRDGSWVYTSLGTQDGIGKGKTNTNIVMAADDGAYASYNNTIWNVLKSMRDNSVDGCNDWFVPSKAEVEAIRTGVDREGNPLSTIFASTSIWSSYEYSASYAWLWGYSLQAWYSTSKHSSFGLIGCRAF